jgi:DNA polymerase-1
MNYLHYSEQLKDEYPVVLLAQNIHRDELKASYLSPYGIDPDGVLVLSLHQSQVTKKTPMKEMRAYLEDEVLHVIANAGAKIVMVNCPEYFKALTKLAKADVNVGYSVPSPYGDFEVFYVPNYKAKFYNPVIVGAKIDSACWAVSAKIGGTYKAPGSGIIHFAEYPDSDADIEGWLNKLLAMDCPLTVDIEAFDLKHHSSGIATICFCWNQHEGISFPVDYVEIPGAVEAPYGVEVRNEHRRMLLRQFFTAMQHKVIYHNIAFDAYALIYQLFMDHILDQKGLQEGLAIMLKNWDCTKLVSYLATNSCAGNKLSLKDQAQAYAGNYAVEDIKDVRRIPLSELLKYNLVDGLATWYVRDKHWDTLDTDLQRDIYDTLFKPATVDIVQMQLTGMPINMRRVKEVRAILEDDERVALAAVHGSPAVQKYTYKLNEQWVAKRNAVLKVKRVTLADAKEVFNPNSDPQLQELLYRELGLPVLAKTKSKQPSTSGDTLKALVFHTADPMIKELLKALVDLKSVSKILTSFIPAMEGAYLGNDGWYYLFGNFNLGGTVSGRLSSSKPK